jgi:uncharacterized protein YkwD
LIHFSATFSRIVQAIAFAVALTWCIAAASTIPTVVEGGRTFVCVEPLLRSLQIGYDIEGTHLEVDGRAYPQPLVERDGSGMADAYVLANFLHLTVTDKNGVLVFSSPPQPADDASPAPPPEAELDTLRAQLLAALNQHRGDAGLDPLDEDPIADEAAQFQSSDMATADTIRHTDAQGRTPLQRYVAMGGRASWYAENVGWYGLDVSDGPSLWTAVSKLDREMMAERPPDDGHRENILGTKYQSVGIGVTISASGIYLAEDFVGR